MPDKAASEYRISDRELDMAGELIESMSGKFEPEKYKDEFRERLTAVIEQRLKSKGVTTTLEEEEPAHANATTNVVDFMALLKKSIEGKQRTPAKGKDEPEKADKAEKKPAAKKAAAKKAEPEAKKASRKSPAKKATPTRKGRKAGLKAARDAFYKGDIAAQVAKFIEKEGGLMRYQDFAAFKVKFEPTVRARFEGIDVHACGPWSQGPVPPMVLNMLQGHDLRKMGHNSAPYIHVVTEALKLAFADRHNHFGDPDFVRVPIAGLMSGKYAAYRSSQINLDRAWPEMPPAGDPGTLAAIPNRWMPVPQSDEAPGPGDTSYVCVIDRNGNAFSATPSDGSDKTPIIPGVGILCSGRGTQSWADPTHPCSVAPGKRPRLTPSPALALRNGGVHMPFGTPGGDVQPQAMLQVFLNINVFGMSPQEAVEAPRFATYSYPGSFEPHAYFPGRLYLESRIDKAVAGALADRGHKIYWWNEMTWLAGAVCTILNDRKNGVLHGGADPRRPAYVLGW